MDLRNFKPVPKRESMPPSSSIGSSGDRAGNWAIDEDYLYYCHSDYSASLTSFSIIVDNQTSSSGLRKESGVSEEDFSNWIKMLDPTAGSWKFSFPTVTAATISNIPVGGVTLIRANGSQSDRRIAIAFNQNLINNLPGFNSNYQLLWNKECVLTGRASIWRRIPLNNSGNW